jgi:3-carboxymuconate cyclase
VFVPHLGTDQVFQFLFDEKSGRLTANTPPVLQLKQGTGPRHLIVSSDNRFVYLLNELTGMVTTLSLDPNAGTLKELDSVSALPADTKLVPGGRAEPSGRPARTRPRGTPTTTSGRRIFTSRRTAACSTPRSALEHARAFRVDTASGKLTYLGSTPTEKQPRGFNIDPTGRFVVVLRRAVGHDLFLRDRRRDRRAEADRTLPDRQGRNWVEIVAFD